MRIAVAGTHAVGKSTLAAELVRALPCYRVVEEAYYQLDAEGHLLADTPSLEDFEAQLERSLRCVREEQGDVIFDRSPADYLAYMLAHREAERATPADWLPRVRETLATLDLIVFVPSGMLFLRSTRRSSAFSRKLRDASLGKRVHCHRD